MGEKRGDAARIVAPIENQPRTKRPERKKKNWCWKPWHEKKKDLPPKKGRKKTKGQRPDKKNRGGDITPGFLGKNVTRWPENCGGKRKKELRPPA